MLYVVSTPIGNLKDITLRALEVLKAVDVIACEDTRHSRILLNHYEIKKPLMSLFQGKERLKTQRVLNELKRGKNIALISDAGTPTIQDPGFVLVRECHEEGIPVVSIPGACALISALSISGIPTHAFVFEGFLPPKSGARRKKIASWKDEKRTVIFYVSPYKLLKTLEDIQLELGDVTIGIARELTKKFEEIRSDLCSTHTQHFSQKTPKGEFVLLIRSSAPR